MCDLDGKEKEFSIGICLFCVILTGVVLFGVSFDTLEPTQVGIKYNFNLVDIQENKVYDNGRYYLGVGLHFIKYPVRLVNLDFLGSNSVRCWSAEGQLIKLDVSLGYRLRRKDVVKIYKRFGTAYNLRLKLLALEGIKEVSTRYEATDFFSQRVQISTAMRQHIAAKFAAEFADIELFNLRQIDLPDGFENKILDKVIKAQEYQTALNLLLIAQVRATNNVIRGNGDALINETLAGADADALRVTENAKSTALRSLREAEAGAYQSLQVALNLNGTDLLRFRWAQIMDKLQNKAGTDFSYVVGFDAPTITVTP